MMTLVEAPAPPIVVPTTIVNLLGSRGLLADVGELAEHAARCRGGLSGADGDERGERTRNGGCRNELDHHDTSLLIFAAGTLVRAFGGCSQVRRLRLNLT
jgi:hypothetical protein